MTAGIWEPEIEQGATFTKVLSWTDENGAVIDLSGYTGAMTGRTTPEAVTTVFELTSGSGITINGPAGTVTITMTAVETAALTAGKGVYDLELTSGANVTRLVRGDFFISREITR